jgi:hypothetical protein
MSYVLMILETGFNKKGVPDVDGWVTLYDYQGTHPIKSHEIVILSIELLKVEFTIVDDTCLVTCVFGYRLPRIVSRSTLRAGRSL